MMRNLGYFAALSVIGGVACAEQEPAVAPLAPPPAATLAAAPAPPPVEAKKEAPKPMPLTPEQKVKTYQDGWAAFNAKDFTKFQAMWAENAKSEMLDMGPPLLGPKAIVEQGAKGFATGFPDATGEIELTLVNGNTIVGIVLTRGTQTGTLASPNGPVPPTGKKVGFLMAHGMELDDSGKILKEFLAYDGGTIAGQLGLMQMPHRKPIETGWTDKPVVVASGSEAEKANLAGFTKETEAFNKHDAPGAIAMAADDIVFSEMSAPADRVGKKESQKGIEDMFKAFPDAKLDVKNAWAAGDYVVATGTWSGTNTGYSPAMKMPKTGKAVSVQFVEIDKVVAGKTKNIWIFSNGAAVAAQLGLMGPKGPEPKGKEGKGPAAKPAAEGKGNAAKPGTDAKPMAKPSASTPAVKPPTDAKPQAAKPAAPATPTPKPAK